VLIIFLADLIRTHSVSLINFDSHHFIMKWFAGLVILAPFLSLVLASPILTTETSPDNTTLSKRDSKFNVTGLNDEFKGIWWNHIFDDEAECSEDELDKLVKATRYVQTMMQFPVGNKNYAYSTAFERYFGRFGNHIAYGQHERAIGESILCTDSPPSKFYAY
jgi:hypothetical protein